MSLTYWCAKNDRIELGKKLAIARAASLGFIAGDVALLVYLLGLILLTSLS